MKSFFNFLLIAFSAAVGAETIFEAQPKYSNEAPTCHFQGAITPAELPPLRRALAQGCKLVSINSGGGDVNAALAMGRAIRSSQAYVTVPSYGRCVSACVFLYAGGVVRMPYAPIKIHRPYNLAPNEYASDQKIFAKTARDIKSFLEEMNVDEELFDRMMRIEPMDSEALTLPELEQLGLGQSDRIYQHHLDKHEAARRGMTTQEFLVVKKRANKICGERDVAMTIPEYEMVSACWDQQMRSHR